MVKSAVLHTLTDLHFTIVTDQQEQLEPRLRETIDKIKLSNITLDFYSPEKDSDIVNKWAPCIGLRTFFPILFPEYKKIIYIDTDVLFQDSPHNLWRHFHHMNRSQIMGVAVDQALISYLPMTMM